MAPCPRRSDRAAYAADITYCTNKEVAADFLRDALVLDKQTSLPRTILRKITGQSQAVDQRCVMRGLACAIVDEADSVLVDEAVTPLIISGHCAECRADRAYRIAAQIAEQLEVRRHFRVNHNHREVRITAAGRGKVAELAPDGSGLWSGARDAEELISQALTARELFHRGQHYVVQEDDVVIVDEFTGRMMPTRNWRDGLHQMVEAKEGLTVKPGKRRWRA